MNRIGSCSCCGKVAAVIADETRTFTVHDGPWCSSWRGMMTGAGLLVTAEGLEALAQWKSRRARLAPGGGVDALANASA